MASLGSNITAAQAFTRFGFGGRPDDVIPSDPVSWLTSQVIAPNPPKPPGSPTVAQGLTYVSQRQQAGQGSPAAIAAKNNILGLFAQEIQTFLSNAVLSQTPFRERLVWFWANHFAVQANKEQTFATSGAYVRDAIRPYVNGRFSDMLAAVITHPAMLCSLNADSSIGPQSPNAVNQVRLGNPQLNINENLARETLELYTMGADTGYTQADVVALAYLLTGFTVNVNPTPRGFIYNPKIAQPGNQVLLGVTYPNTQAGCMSALLALGTSAITYRHIATKLVQHFVSDTPAQSDIDTVTNTLVRTQGNIGQAAQALAGLTNAWVPLTKLRTPAELVVAALRASGTTAATMPSSINSIIKTMGQPTFAPPFPNGWSNFAADWISPSSLVMRNDWLGTFSNGLSGVDALTVADSCLGPLLSNTTRALIGQTAAPSDKLILLFCSPEFQRR